MQPGRALALMLALLALTLGACGPIDAASAIADAKVAIEMARVSEAERYSPYSFTLARLYLRKAKEEQHYSCFEAAIDLAVRARKAAEEARRKALASPERGEPAGGRVSLPPPVGGEVAP